MAFRRNKLPADPTPDQELLQELFSGFESLHTTPLLPPPPVEAPSRDELELDRHARLLEMVERKDLEPVLYHSTYGRALATKIPAVTWDTLEDLHVYQLATRNIKWLRFRYSNLVTAIAFAMMVLGIVSVGFSLLNRQWAATVICLLALMVLQFERWISRRGLMWAEGSRVELRRRTSSRRGEYLRLRVAVTAGMLLRMMGESLRLRHDIESKLDALTIAEAVARSEQYLATIKVLDTFMSLERGQAPSVDTAILELMKQFASIRDAGRQHDVRLLERGLSAIEMTRLEQMVRLDAARLGVSRSMLDHPEQALARMRRLAKVQKNINGEAGR